MMEHFEQRKHFEQILQPQTVERKKVLVKHSCVHGEPYSSLAPWAPDTHLPSPGHCSGSFPGLSKTFPDQR